MWYMHDDAWPHFSVVARELSQSMDWNGEPQSWTPRSPDINPLDSFLRAFAETVVYQSESISQCQLDICFYK